MVSILTEERLITLLQSICEGERKLEVCRQLLCEPLYFEPHAAFSRLDRLSLGYLTHSDLHNFFLSNSNIQTYSDIAMLLKNIDKYRDSRITYEEFIDFVLPKQDAGLKAIATSRAQYIVRPSEFMEYELEVALMRLFYQVITNAKTYDLLREDLRRDYQFATSTCFEIVKDPLLPLINLNSLDRFLRLHNKILPENELHSGIMFGDVDGDGSLSYTEFSDLLIIGMPAPVQTSPSKIRLSPSRANGTSESSVLRFSPSRVVSRASGYRPIASPRGSPSRTSVYRSVASPSRASAYRSVASPSRVSSYRPVASPRGSTIVSYPTNSPGGQKIAEKHEEENYQKVDDNIKYSQYIQTSQENSIKKSMSPSRVYQSSYISSPSRVSRAYVSPRKSQAPISAISQGPSKELEKQQLMNLLNKMIANDRELQNLKTQLSIQQDFNLLDAFRLFDVNQNQNISKLEFEKCLNQMGIFPNQDQIYLFYKVFDLNQDGFLYKVFRYGDFTQVFYTPNSTQVNLLKSRAPGFVEPLEGESEHDIFNFDTRQLLKRFFNQVFDTETTLDQFREQLQLRPMFNLYDAFKALDIDQDGVINYEELKIMLNSYGIYTTENDMLNLFGRFDKDKDGKIKYQEFIQEVAPKSPSRYTKY